MKILMIVFQRKNSIHPKKKPAQNELA